METSFCNIYHLNACKRVQECQRALNPEFFGCIVLLSFIVPLYVAADYASAWQFVPSIVQIKYNFVEAMFGGLFYQGLKQATLRIRRQRVL